MIDQISAVLPILQDAFSWGEKANPVFEAILCNFVLLPCDETCAVKYPCKGYFARLTAVLDDNLATRLVDSEDCTTLMDNDSVVKQLRSILDVLSMDTSTTMDELFTSLKNGCDGVISYLQELAPGNPSESCFDGLDSPNKIYFPPNNKTGFCTNQYWDSKRREEENEAKWKKHLGNFLSVKYAFFFFGCFSFGVIALADHDTRFKYPWHLWRRVHSLQSVIASTLSFVFGFVSVPFFMGYSDSYIPTNNFRYSIILVGLASVVFSLNILFAYPFWDLNFATEKGSFRFTRSLQSNTDGSKLSVYDRLYVIWYSLRNIHQYYARYFSVQGTYFVLKAGIFEVVEILVQLAGIIRGGDEMNFKFLTTMLIVVLINSIASPLLFIIKILIIS